MRTCRRMAELARDRSPVVRIAVADNLNTPQAALEMLAQDEQPDVRYALAENPHTPIFLLEVMLCDEHPYVASRARKTLSRLQCEPHFFRHCA